MELITGSAMPAVLLDGAHNPHGIAALTEALKQLLPQLGLGPATVLTGVLANHWQPGMLRPLVASLPTATVIATAVPGSTNALPPERLAVELGPGARAIADPATALRTALANARNAQGLLVVCGSLYLVGYVRSQLLGAHALA
jgi:dihydrofolate synthase/folylpolyglutamate synthase